MRIGSSSLTRLPEVPNISVPRRRGPSTVGPFPARSRALVRPSRPVTRCLVAAALLSLVASVRAGAEPQPPARDGGGPGPGEGAPIVLLFLDGPRSLDVLLKALDHPNFVLLKGDEYRRLLERA